MKNIIHSIKQTDYSTIITTKSGIVRTYTFNSINQNNEFYNSQLKCSPKYSRVLQIHNCKRWSVAEYLLM